MKTMRYTLKYTKYRGKHRASLLIYRILHERPSQSASARLGITEPSALFKVNTTGTNEFLSYAQMNKYNIGALMTLMTSTTLMTVHAFGQGIDHLCRPCARRPTQPGSCCLGHSQRQETRRTTHLHIIITTLEVDLWVSIHRSKPCQQRNKSLGDTPSRDISSV